MHHDKAAIQNTFPLTIQYGSTALPASLEVFAAASDTSCWYKSTAEKTMDDSDGLSFEPALLHSKPR
jgi:hypothetical protein